ncbi:MULTISPECIES: hypothetical protein [Streptacidiphilus]|uniref:Uncharacterized protein n=1 Tax=Streptacidiphilus cavernicola TaxID=3342716 RepID=A0ABV6UTV8_9ACTN|nr:hypothetical protein [Streptacidiphilus jeojiense]
MLNVQTAGTVGAVLDGEGVGDDPTDDGPEDEADGDEEAVDETGGADSATADQEVVATAQTPAMYRKKAIRSASGRYIRESPQDCRTGHPAGNTLSTGAPVPR